MASQTTYTLRTEIFNINKDNVDNALEEHFKGIIKYIILHEMRNIKIITKIEGVSIVTDIVEKKA